MGLNQQYSWRRSSLKLMQNLGHANWTYTWKLSECRNWHRRDIWTRKISFGRSRQATYNKDTVTYSEHQTKSFINQYRRTRKIICHLMSGIIATSVNGLANNEWWTTAHNLGSIEVRRWIPFRHMKRLYTCLGNKKKKQVSIIKINIRKTRPSSGMETWQMIAKSYLAGDILLNPLEANTHWSGPESGGL